MMPGDTLTMDDLNQLVAVLADAPPPAPKIMVVPSWGEMKRVPTGRRWWQFWLPKWKLERQEPDHVLEMDCGTVLCTARQKAWLEAQVKAYKEPAGMGRRR